MLYDSVHCRDQFYPRGSRDLRPENFDESTLAHLRNLPQAHNLYNAPATPGGGGPGGPMSAREAFRRRAPTSQRSAYRDYPVGSAGHGGCSGKRGANRTTLTCRPPT